MKSDLLGVDVVRGLSGRDGLKRRFLGFVWEKLFVLKIQPVKSLKQFLISLTLCTKSYPQWNQERVIPDSFK